MVIVISRLRKQGAMSPEIYELTGFQRDLLYAMPAFDRPSGQTIRAELEEYTDREITHGRLYPNLDTLVEMGLVERGQIDRRTNFYAITDDGKSAIRRYRGWQDERLDFID